MMWLISFQALSQTISADLTGDGVDDELRIGERSIIIIDGAQGKRYIPLKDVKIFDYKIVPFNEYYVLAVLNAKGVALIGFSKGEFVILDSLYYEIGYTIARFEFLQDRCSGKNVLTAIGDYNGVSIPIILLSKNLKFIIFDTTNIDSKEAQVGSGEIKYINPIVRKEETLFLKVLLKDYDISLRIDAGECGVFKVGRVSSYSGFFYNGSDHDERFTIFFDNTYSIFTSKSVRYVMIKFKSQPYLFE